MQDLHENHNDIRMKEVPKKHEENTNWLTLIVSLTICAKPYSRLVYSEGKLTLGILGLQCCCFSKEQHAFETIV